MGVPGSLTIRASAVANSAGLLMVNGGSLTASAAVTGSGEGRDR